MRWDHTFALGECRICPKGSVCVPFSCHQRRTSAAHHVAGRRVVAPPKGRSAKIAVVRRQLNLWPRFSQNRRANSGRAPVVPVKAYCGPDRDVAKLDPCEELAATFAEERDVLRYYGANLTSDLTGPRLRLAHATRLRT